MQITLNISPDDLANIIVDKSIHVLHCKNVLNSIVDEARKQVQIQSDEMEQMDYLLSEYKDDREKSKTLMNEKNNENKDAISF